jgi:hypothetical protein
MQIIEGSLCSLAPWRFLCDEMLSGLVQWLRVAGYDTSLPTQGAPDRQLVHQARHEDRWIITADTDLLTFNAAPCYVIYLTEKTEPERLRELTDRLNLDWYPAPFSRCKNCNTPLRVASERDLARFSPGVPKTAPQPIMACERCRQLFWQGSHVKRMSQQLEAMNRWRQGVD